MPFLTRAFRCIGTMGPAHGSITTELRLRADDLKHLVRPKYVKGLTRSAVAYARPMFGSEPLHGQEVLVLVGRFRHHIDGSGSQLSSSWEVLTYDLAAVKGTIGNHQLRFQGVTTHLFDRFMNCRVQGNDATSHFFVLGPGELVRGIDICWQDQHRNSRLIGIRLQTNQRHSQWFGQRHGVVKSITAPQGYFINALDRLRDNTRWELGLRLCPVNDRLTRSFCTVTTAKEKSARVGNPTHKDGVQTDFALIEDEVRAIVVKCSDQDGFEDLHVLSTELYNRHLATREEPLPAKVHVVFLRHSEYLVEVETRATDKIVALRFHTNLTKSPWYGTQADGKEPAQLHSFRVPDQRQQIVGFHGTFGEKYLGSLGVFYRAIPATAPADQETRPIKTID